MAQVIARVDEALLERIDELVDRGVIASRSEGVRLGLEQLIERTQREERQRREIAAYQSDPQDANEVKAARRAAFAMVREEPW